jgi:alkylation response protein AidB-like acyl-CoA dehydrogenase
MRRLLTQPQQALADEVRRFFERTSPPALTGHSEADFWALVEYQRQVHSAGLAAVSWPVEYGGRGLGLIEAAIVAEEMGRAQAPQLVNFIALDVVAPALMRHATPAQCRTWLPPMPGADKVWCQMFSEPGAGSDLASLSTVAQPDGNGWRIDGQKVWSTWGHYAHNGLLLARTGPPATRHRGITAFVVDMHQPAVEARPLRTMSGSDEFAEVFFDGLHVTPEAVVGEVDGGWAVAMTMLAAERSLFAIGRAAIIRAGLESLRAEIGSQRLPQHARNEVVDAYIALRLLDLRIDQQVEALGRGESPGPEAALSKVLLTRADQAVFAAAQHSQGLRGTAWLAGSAAASWAERYLYSRATSIYGGTLQIQMNIIGERLLGLPR